MDVNPFAAAIAQAGHCLVSSFNALEVSVVVSTRKGPAGGRELDRMPSDYLKTNLRATIQLDGAAISYRHLIGVDRIMYSTDFPHATCDWPNSRQWTHFMLKGLPAHEQEMILGRNALDWYGIN